MGDQFREEVTIRDNEEAYQLFGQGDEHLETIESSFDVRLISRGSELVITGNEVEVQQVAALFERLLGILRSGKALTEQEVSYAVRLTKEGNQEPLAAVFSDVVMVTHRGKEIRPMTLGQKRYVETIHANELAFGIGPAGTGKTYLALAVAVAALRQREVTRIILARPAVEAGEHLGFLPGDLQEKVDPYLRPLYDALYEMLGAERFERYMGRGMIEVAPLAYMRGRTLDDSFVILDEAQNTTVEQMKMFLTRLGFNSRAVVTGDVTQVDLPTGKYSGLAQVRQILRGIDGIGFIELSDRDVVRHPLVQRIIQAYERHDRARDGHAAQNAH